MKRSTVAFLLAGAAIFAAWHLVESRRRTVEVSPELQAALVRELEEGLGRAATPTERRAALDAWVEDEVLFREAMARGLGSADPVVRRRLVQAMRFLLEAEGPRASAAPATRGTLAVADVEQRFFTSKARAVAARPAGAAAPSDDGEAFIAGPTLMGLTEQKAAATFGPELGLALSSLELGVWTGPLRSAHGWHWVRVVARRQLAAPPAPPPSQSPAVAGLRAGYSVRLPEAAP
jgi:peptidyl-prolyl cis-trans isomerase C